MFKRTDDRDARQVKPKRAVSRVFFSVLLLCILAVGGMAVSTFSDNLKNNVIVNESGGQETTAPTVTTTSTATPVAVNTAQTTVTTTASTVSVTTVAQTTTTTAAVKEPPAFVTPSSGDVIEGFSQTPVWNDTLAEYRVHTATDFATKTNDVIVAITRGEITDVGEDPIKGRFVIIDHSGITASYYGVTATVNIGDTVDTGDPIGKHSAVPFEAHHPSHIHLELTRDGQPIDVTSLITPTS